MKNFILLFTEFIMALLIFLMLIIFIGFINKNQDLTHAKINENVLLVLVLLYSINLGIRAAHKF